MKLNLTVHDIALSIALIVLAVAMRTIFHIAPNVEFVTAAALVAGFYLSEKKLALIVPIVIMAISDVIIGNTLIYLFTWSGFLAMPLLSFVAKSKYIQRILPSSELAKVLIIASSSAIVATLWFFIWTNFGVAALGWYPMTVEGLTQCYINALPFLRNQLIGNSVILPGMFLIVHIMQLSFEIVTEKYNFEKSS